jgi:hypothetical protein
MRLQEYLLREARVQTSNADVFLDSYVPVFMWSPKTGLIWAISNVKPSDDYRIEDKWSVYHNSKNITGSYSIKGDFTTHKIILSIYNKNLKLEDFICGRISPDGRTIYIHGIEHRDYNNNFERNFDRYVDKAVNAVYKYMRDYIR